MKEKIGILKSGQALVVLLVFVAVASVVTGSAVTVAVINLRLGSDSELGQNAFSAAEAGAHEAILSLLRNPSYSGGTLSLNGSVATMTVSPGSGKTILSEGSMGKFKRKIQVLGTYANNAFTVTSWREIN